MPIMSSILSQFCQNQLRGLLAIPSYAFVIALCLSTNLIFKGDFIIKDKMAKLNSLANGVRGGGKKLRHT
jgi:hypothetical protein